VDHLDTYVFARDHAPTSSTGLRGGTLMLLGAILFFVVISLTIVAGKLGAAPTDFPGSEAS
jgi:hypothetical protein